MRKVEVVKMTVLFNKKDFPENLILTVKHKNDIEGMISEVKEDCIGKKVLISISENHVSEKNLTTTGNYL